MDAFATPFVQGRLRSEVLSVRVKSSCAHCGKPVELTIDSNLDCTVHDPDCRPVVFVPDVDLLALREESIINAF